MLGRTSGPVARAARQQSKFRSGIFRPRYQSTSSNTAHASSNPALVGGLAGGAVALVSGYSWYHFSGTKTLVKTSKETHAYIAQAKELVAQKSSEPNEAFRWLKETIQSYAAFIPGARSYVDKAFEDLDKIRDDHGNEFDGIVKNACNELNGLLKKEGLSMNSAFTAVSLLQNYSKQLFDLASDAAYNVFDNHPQLKEKLGGSVDQLREMGDAYGPEAKREVDRTWRQISSIVQRGASMDSVEEIKNLLHQKKEKLDKLKDETWQKGIDESGQYLEKSPKLKQLIEENADDLKKSNTHVLWGLVKESASSGNIEDAENYITKKVHQAKQSNSGELQNWLSIIPGGSNVLPQLQSLHSVSQNKGSEAEDVLKETLQEIQDVLKKRKGQIERITEEGKEKTK